MANQFYTPINDAGTTLSTAYTAGAGSLVVANAAAFGATPTLPFRVTVTDGTNKTIYGVTAVSGSTLTVSGAIEGTTDRNYAVGASVECWVTAGDINDMHAIWNANSFPRTFTFVLGSGTPVTVGTDKTNRLTVDRNATVVKASVNAKTAPAGASLIVDISSSPNGSTWTSLWATNTANRPSLAAGSTTGSQASFDTTALSEGSLLRIDVAQVGSTTAGQDVTVQLLTLMRNY